MREPNENRLARWSRKKREAVQEKSTQVQADDALPKEATGREEGAVADVKTEETIRVEDLPDVETLTYESDFTQFLRDGVPEELRTLALRKLWTSNPVFANLDGLNDYDPSTKEFLVSIGTASKEVIAEFEKEYGPIRKADETDTAAADDTGAGEDVRDPAEMTGAEDMSATETAETDEANEAGSAPTGTDDEKEPRG